MRDSVKEENVFHEPRVGDIVVLKRDRVAIGRISGLTQLGLMDEHFPFKYGERYRVEEILPATSANEERRLVLRAYVTPVTIAGETHTNTKSERYRANPPISLFEKRRKEPSSNLP